jgi:tRNA dimethylallyltransferase
VARHLALVGQTASGKSALALLAAKRLGDIEIVSVDSMQVYRGMDIGTDKPNRAARDAVPHHLLDVADPSEEFSVAQFQAAALAAIADIERRGKRALLVGGTGLYFQAVVDGLQLPGQWPIERAQIESEPDTPALYAQLSELDPIAAGRMESTNRRRVVRALEVTLGSGRAFSSFGGGLTAYPPSPFLLAGIVLSPDVVNDRIAVRYERQLAAGFVDEVRALAGRPAGLSRTARQALGYRELLAHVEGTASLHEAIDLAVRRTRRFARRQRAWFRRDPRIRWVTVDGADACTALPALLGEWS